MLKIVLLLKTLHKIQKTLEISRNVSTFGNFKNIVLQSVEFKPQS